MDTWEAYLLPMLMVVIEHPDDASHPGRMNLHPLHQSFSSLLQHLSITIIILSIWVWTSYKVCQMLFCWMENSLHSINIWDTTTKVIPLCSLYQTPSYELNLTLLALFLPKFRYLSMLIILQVVCTAFSADHLKNKLHAQISPLCGKWCWRCEVWNKTHNMTPGIMNTMVTLLWLHLRYW